MRGDQRLTKGLIKSRIRQVQRNCGFLSLGFSCFFQLFPEGFSLALDPRVDWEAWKGRLGVLLRNFRTMRVVFWVSVCESSGAGLLGLSWTYGL